MRLRLAVVPTSESGLMMLAKAVSTISSPDYRIMRRVNRWYAPRWIRCWMIASTRAGDGWLWGACGIGVLTSGAKQRFAAFTAALVAVLTGIVIFKVLKHWVRRTRPCELEPHCWFGLLPPDQFSFPSGHTITGFAVACSLGLFYPGLMPSLLFCACSVAGSRVMLGMHFLSDVVVGALIGAGLGYFFTTMLIH